MTTRIEFTVEEGVATLTFARPEKRNALDTVMLRECLAAFEACERDETVRAIVLEGKGEAFCAGADLREFRDLAPEAAATASQARIVLLHAVLEAVFFASKPVIAAVDGFALGAGAAFVLAADVALVTRRASVGFPEVEHGMMPGLMVAPVVRRVDAKTAFALLVECRRFDAAGAVAAGLATRVVEAPESENVKGETVRAEAVRVARQLARFDPATVAGTKRLIAECEGLSLRAGLARGRDRGH